jgi:toxin secretion/phage lysis holin
MQELFEHFAFKSGWAAFLACFGWLLGGLDLAVLALFVLYVVDFGLGLYRAWSTCALSASKARKGMAKLVLYVIVIICAHMLDVSLAQTLPFLAHYVRNTIIVFVAITEFLSVCTHLAALGLRVPEALQARLRSYRDGSLDGHIASAGLVPSGATQPQPTKEE